MQWVFAMIGGDWRARFRAPSGRLQRLRLPHREGATGQALAYVYFEKSRGDDLPPACSSATMADHPRAIASAASPRARIRK
jgi:hypothetical protein